MFYLWVHIMDTCVKLTATQAKRRSQFFIMSKGNAPKTNGNRPQLAAAANDKIENPLSVDLFGNFVLHPSYMPRNMSVVQYLELTGLNVPSMIAAGLEDIFDDAFVQTGEAHLRAIPSLETAKTLMQNALQVNAMTTGGISPEMQERIGRAKQKAVVTMFARHGVPESDIPASQNLADIKYSTPAIPPPTYTDEVYLRPARDQIAGYPSEPNVSEETPVIDVSIS
jgi:hypothetical protein